MFRWMPNLVRLYAVYGLIAVHRIYLFIYCSAVYNLNNFAICCNFYYYSEYYSVFLSIAQCVFSCIDFELPLVCFVA